MPVGSAWAEDVRQTLDKTNEYYQQKNYSKALQELAWAQKEIEKANSQVLESLFPAEIQGFKGAKLESTNMLGFTTIERSYEKGETLSIKASLLGSGQGQGQNPLGGLAALGQMAAMMGGGQPGTDSFRLDGRTAMLQKQEDSAELTVFLEAGAMLKFELNGSADGELLKKFASGFKLAEIEKQLKG
jgi:hypothetical protein